MGKKLPRFFHCPTEFTLHMLGGKWKTVILCFLKERPCRYAELRKLLPKLSDKMLTERLHILRHLDTWGVENARSFDVQVGTPLADLDNERMAGQTHDRPRAAPESQRGM
jgi:HxlR-like helix-turn-helix